MRLKNMVTSPAEKSFSLSEAPSSGEESRRGVEGDCWRGSKRYKTLLRGLAMVVVHSVGGRECREGREQEEVEVRRERVVDVDLNDRP